MPPLIDTTDTFDSIDTTDATAAIDITDTTYATVTTIVSATCGIRLGTILVLSQALDIPILFVPSLVVVVVVVKAREAPPQDP